MPITGTGWELYVNRLLEQGIGTKARTVGTYQVFHDGKPVTSTVTVDGVAVPLAGTTAESRGPGQNDKPATSAKPSRIVAKSYPLMTSGGPTYVTTGYRQDHEIKAKMPGIELRETGNRSAILIHPGKDEFLSSIGCINLCTRLPDSHEIINYRGSRRRVIALIEDMKAFLGNVPTAGDKPIPRASVVIDEHELLKSAIPAAHADDVIDGKAVAAANGVDVKPGAKISSLHPKMEAVIIAVAKAANALGLPKPVITSGNDSKHKIGSLHFKNRALDFRGNNITDAKGEALEAKVKQLLGKGYDVIFEKFPSNPANDHLHVEFDPI